MRNPPAEIPMNLVPFDPTTASHEECVALHAFTSAMRTELLPDDALTPLEEAIAVWRMNVTLADVPTWLVRDETGAVLARGQAVLPRSGGNRSLAQGNLEVLPSHRRRGFARALLARLAPAMREAERSVLIVATLARAPGGAAFMERLGAERGLETTVSQLRLDSLDRSKVSEWAHRDASGEFEIGFWDGPYPEADLEAICGLQEVMLTQPLGRIAVEHERPGAALLRKAEAAMATRDRRRWTAYARERATSRFAGFTELTWLPRAPELLEQGNTGVFPELRGRGLGLRLKAAMLERVLRELPRARFVRTSNADVNASMLAINHALGFAPYQERTVWQAPLERIEAWLAAAGAAVTPS
jgi:GNAT superfamily N-acetyltransferase